MLTTAWQTSSSIQHLSTLKQCHLRVVIKPHLPSAQIPTNACVPLVSIFDYLRLQRVVNTRPERVVYARLERVVYARLERVV